MNKIFRESRANSEASTWRQATRSDDVDTVVHAVRSSTKASSDGGIRRAFDRFLSAAADDPEMHRLISRNGDIVGPAYERLVQASFRRHRGQFFTPPWAGELMATWVLRCQPSVVVDPGVGSGALLLQVAARSRMPRLIGIDSDPVAISMAEANLRLRDIRADLRCADFLLSDKLQLLPAADAVVCNPPYGRHNSIPRQTRDRIRDSIQSATGASFDSRTGVASLFLIRAIHQAADGARLAFITPSGWLDPNYGRAVLDYLLQHTHVNAKILLPNDHLLFDNVLTTAAITLITKRTRGERCETKLLRLSGALPSVFEVLESVDSRNNGSSVKVILNRDWRAHSQSNTVAEFPLSRVATVHRGIATGFNKFFVLTEELRRAWRIPKSKVQHCVASPRHFPGKVMTTRDLQSLRDSVPRWLLVCSDGDVEADSAVGNYLRWGRDELDADERYITQHRTPWYAIGITHASPILFPYFNRSSPRFIRNRAKAAPLNNFLVIRPASGVNADALCELLNAPTFIARLAAHRRVYGGGLWKLEPNELATVDLGVAGEALLREPPNRRRRDD